MRRPEGVFIRSVDGGLPRRLTICTPFLPIWSFPVLNLDLRGDSLPALNFLIFVACWNMAEGVRLTFSGYPLCFLVLTLQCPFHV